MSIREFGVPARAFAAALLLTALGECRPISAEELPHVRQGLWEFKRTVEGLDPSGKPQVMTTSRCVDPNSEWKKRREAGAQMGCTFTPLTKNAGTFSFTATCPIQGTSVVSTSTFTFDGDTAYTVKIEAAAAGKTSHETLSARRSGDCTP